MSDKTYVGRNVSDFEAHIGLDVSSLEETPAFPPYSKVILWVDEETAFIAGDNSGRTMEATLPWATQTIANDVLAKINGFVYCPFSATDANVNPAVELGDGASVAGIYAPLAVMTTVFDPLFTSEISAPYDEEIDHEYPYVNPTTREIQRKVALGRSYYGSRITRANGLEVVKTEADGTEKSRAKLNSDILAFYNDNGEEALYFDAMTGKYRFRGDVEVTGGSMNINDAFIVDPQGNLTLTGNINLSGGTITWGDNLPPSGISAETATQIAGTVVSKELVAAPTIMGAKVYGGAFYDSYGGGRLTLSYGANAPVLTFEGDVDGEYRSVFSVGTVPDTGYIGISVGNGSAWESSVDSGNGEYSDIVALGTHTFAHSAIFEGSVDFSGATVTGLDIVFG